MIYRMDLPVDRILATSDKALALDNNLAEAHASRGVALSAAQRIDEAQAEFEQVRKLAAEEAPAPLVRLPGRKHP